MQKKIVIAALCCLQLAQVWAAEEVRIPKGFKQATMNPRVLTQDITLANMPIGSERTVLDDAVFVDEEGKVWLVGKSPTYSTEDKISKIATVTVRRSRMGYFVDIPYRHKVVNGYSVPKHSQWRSGGHATRYYHIPAMSALVKDPIYEKPSALRQKEHDLAKPYQPSFKRPAQIPNPYSLGEDKSDVEFITNAITRVRSGSPAASGSPSPASSPSPIPNPPN